MAILDDTVEDSTLELGQVDETPEVQEEDDVPEKYRGKSAKDIIKMHQEAEKLNGRHGSELGELRKVVDDFIKVQTSKETKQEPELDDDSFFTDPQTAVKKAIDNHPSVREAKQASLAMKQQEVLNKLGSKHPNFMDTVQDPSFAEWVQGSRIRTEMYARAEANFDFDAADELLSNWNERKQVSEKVAQTSKVDKQQQLKAASVSTQGASDSVSKKKYRRTDIIKLMQTDRNQYEARADEFMAAYREGRVY